MNPFLIVLRLKYSLNVSNKYKTTDDNLNKSGII